MSTVLALVVGWVLVWIVSGWLERKAGSERRE